MMSRNEIRAIFCGDSATRERLSEQYPDSPALNLIFIQIHNPIPKGFGLLFILMGLSGISEIDFLEQVENDDLNDEDKEQVAGYFDTTVEAVWS